MTSHLCVRSSHKPSQTQRHVPTSPSLSLSPDMPCRVALQPLLRHASRRTRGTDAEREGAAEQMFGEEPDGDRRKVLACSAFARRWNNKLLIKRQEERLGLGAAGPFLISVIFTEETPARLGKAWRCFPQEIRVLLSDLIGSLRCTRLSSFTSFPVIYTGSPNVRVRE